MYSLAGNSLSLKQELEHHGAVTDVVYSSDGQYLAACDAHRKVVIYALPGYEVWQDGVFLIHSLVSLPA